MKLTFFIFALCFSFSSLASLLLVGGGKRPEKAMREFRKAAGGDKSRILIIPWASVSIESSEAIKRELEDFGAGEILVAPHELNSLNLEKFKNTLMQASGVFFAGGDQNKLMETLSRFKLISSMKQLFSAGAIFAGTSAGTAIMSNPMITGESDLTELNSKSTKLSEGLGLLRKGVIVDQHFVKRMRFNRLAGLVLDEKAFLGIGVDEDAALWIEKGKLKVFGEGPVLFMKSSSAQKMILKVLRPNDEINMNRDEFFTFSLLK